VGICGVPPNAPSTLNRRSAVSKFVEEPEYLGYHCIAFKHRLEMMRPGNRQESRSRFLGKLHAAGVAGIFIANEKE
jgi:hypothetical protein